MKRSDFHFTFTPCMVVTCCALHNFCEHQKEHFNVQWTEAAAEQERGFPQPVAPASHTVGQEAKNIRQALTDHMTATYPLRAH